jgi:hypothetical protein
MAHHKGRREIKRRKEVAVTSKTREIEMKLIKYWSTRTHIKKGSGLKRDDFRFL